MNESTQTSSPGIKIINPETIDFTIPPAYGPMNQGFDYSYILPASLDMPPYCYLENNKLTAPLTGQTQGSDPANGTTGAFWRAGLMVKLVWAKLVGFIRRKPDRVPNSEQ